LIETKSRLKEAYDTIARLENEKNNDKEGYNKSLTDLIERSKTFKSQLDA